MARTFDYNETGKPFTGFILVVCEWEINREIRKVYYPNIQHVTNQNKI